MNGCKIGKIVDGLECGKHPRRLHSGEAVHGQSQNLNTERPR